MKSLGCSLLFLPFFLLSAVAQDDAPEKALKYHSALLKRPANQVLFDRFFGAWLDEQPIETLDAFLQARAKEQGEQNLAILAHYQLRRGRETEALETLGKAIAALPKEFSLPMERAKILIRRLDFEEARKDLSRVAEGTDQVLALQASKLIGKSWLREGKPEQAIETWNALLAAHPGDEDLLEDLVEAAAAEGEAAQALTYIEKLISISDDPYKKALRQLRRGDLLAESNRNDDAVEAYSETLAQTGEGSWLEREILAQIDKAYRKQDRIDDLKGKLVELTAANPRRLLIHRELAKIEAAQGEIDTAVGRFREVLKRSPGNRELREEFVRLLTNGEKFKEAAEELQKLIETAPDDAGLFLQMAELRSRQEDKKAVREALDKAHEILGDSEVAGIRIASLMFQYQLEEPGEKLLKDLRTRKDATPAPSEALASQYARSNRKAEALEVLKQLAKSDNLEVVLRASDSISALGNGEAAFEILSGQLENFGQEPRFLTSITKAALATGNPEAAITHAVKLVRLSEQSTDLANSIGLALRAISDAEKSLEWRDKLEKQESLKPSETCLLAALADAQGDFETVTEIMTGKTDPMLIRFHAALLDRRGDLPAAIKELSRLADTTEGRKASYFKEMTELQRRAGLTDDALATVEKWKQSAPGDKTAWVIGGSILREAGRHDEAIKETRQAVAKFKEDENLAATLASLHEDVGQMLDAEAIYWRLYDDSERPLDQARWAVQLAELAVQMGRTDEMEEKLRERARGNRRSIGPLLAQAELARITQDDDKRRDLLLEAIRIKPNDVELRLKVASLEEQSGNPDRVIAILEEAVKNDDTGRIRSSLAQAYLRQGQTLKGMRELRAMAGKQGNDPRTIEQNAANLANSGLYEEAIRYMREVLPDGGDWRSQYLLALMLEQDGRETESIPIFQAVQQATGELPGKTNARANPNDQWKNYPKEIRDIGQIMVFSQAAYSHKNANSYGNYNVPGMSGAGAFVLPDDPEVARSLAAIHLIKLGADGVENSDFIKDLTASGNQSQPNFPELLAKYPDQPGLFEITILYGSWNNQGNALDTALLEKQLSERKDLDPIYRFQGNLILAQQSDNTESDWKKVISTAKEVAKENKANTAPQLAYQLLQILSDETTELPNPELPENVRDSLSNILVELVSSEHLQQSPFAYFELMAMKVAGTRDQWIEVVNENVETFRKDQATNRISSQSNPYAQMHYAGGGGRYNPWMANGSPFKLPEIQQVRLNSVPINLLQMMQPEESDQNYYGSANTPPADLLPKLDSFTSPVLRAWIAMQAGDEKAAGKTLSAKPPENETTDFALLRAYQALSNKKYSEAYELFSELRASYSSDRNLTTWLNFSLAAIAAEIPKEKRTELNSELRAILIQLKSVLGIDGRELLIAQANQLDMPELAERFAPQINNSAIGSPPQTAGFGSTASSGGDPTIEKLKKFSSEGKIKGAAMEAMRLIRRAKSNGNNNYYEIEEVKESITPGVREELIKMADPGNSKSLTKRLEYAEICNIFGQTEKAIATLSELNRQRPDDTSIAGKLAFLLPAEQQDKTIALISKAVLGNEFPDEIETISRQLSANRNNRETFTHFSTVIRWLENTDPKEYSETNLSWVSYQANYFYLDRYTENLSPLNQQQKGKPRDPEAHRQYLSLAKRLASAMLRFNSLAEEGFRLLNGSRAWEIPAEELDEKARGVILAAALEKNTSYNPYGSADTYFTLRSRNSYSGSGEEWGPYSSVAWITSRLNTAKSPAEILPPEFLQQLSGKNAPFGEMITAFANLSEVKELETLWASDALKNNSGPFAEMLKHGIMTRAASVPGSQDFFLERIKELKGTLKNSRHTDDSTSLILVAALKTTPQATAAQLAEICSAISNVIFGDTIDLSSTANSRETAENLRQMESVLEKARLQPQSAIRAYKAFYRLGVPVGSDAHRITKSFSDIQFTSVNGGLDFMKSVGLMDDTDNWEPLFAIIAESKYDGGTSSFTRKEIPLIPEIISHIDFGQHRNLITFHLENFGSFGSIITAAFLKDGIKRSKLVAKAFAVATPELGKMSAQRLADFELLLPWLPADVLANLPPVFREQAKGANQELLGELTETANAFLKKSVVTNRHSNPFDEVEALVRQLAPLDLDKAVEVFLEAERRFTAGVVTGGSGLSNGRDRALNGLFQDNETNLTTDLSVILRFYSAIVNSASATRFTFGSSYNGNPILHQIGDRLYNHCPGKTSPKTPRTLLATRYASSMPEEVRNDAYIALAKYMLFMDINYRGMILPDERKKLGRMNPVSEEFKALSLLGMGVHGWASDTAEGRELTKESLLYFLNNQAIAPVTRFQLVSYIAKTEYRIAADAQFCEAYADLFETYAAGERSVVNDLVLRNVEPFAAAIVTPEALPAITRINQAFWKNANSAKAGGHPPIPPDFAEYLLALAAYSGDTASQNKILQGAKSSLEGNISLIVYLIRNGKYELAKEMLMPMNGFYRNGQMHPWNTAAFERHLPEFEKTPGLDPIQSLRLQAAVVGTTTEPGQETEMLKSIGESEREVIAAYKANPPSDRMLRTEILYQITGDSHYASIQLRDELIALTKELDLRRAFDDWHNETGSENENTPRDMIAGAELGIFRQAAFAQFLKGDLSGLNHIADTFAELPTSGSTSRNGNDNFPQQFLQRMMCSAPAWIAEAIHTGETSAFKDAFPIFEKFSLTVEKHKNLSRWDIQCTLALAEFFAYWENEGEKFTALFKKIKHVSNELNFFNKRWSMEVLAKMGNYQMGIKESTWRQERFFPARRSMFIAVLTRPEMKAYSGHFYQWIPSIANIGFYDDLSKIAANPPEGIAPHVIAMIQCWKGVISNKEGNFETAVTAYRSAVESYSKIEDWIPYSVEMKVYLVRSLIKTGKPHEAEKVYASLSPNELPDGKKYKNVYDKVGKELNAALKK